MLPKNSSAIAAALTLTLTFLTTSAIADGAVHEGRDRNAARAYPLAALRHTYHYARHHDAPQAGYAAEVHAPWYFGSGYVFVPGRGIVGEDCDMPTSTCPNEVRDTQ
jgi:hypothetical protein